MGHCPVCDDVGKAISEPFEGYVRGYLTCIKRCGACGVHFSERRDIPELLYEQIYANAGRIAGYDRYVRFADEVRGHDQPLNWLAEQEAPYALVRDVLADAASSTSVLELGCGMGYLTYAMRRAGFDAVGVDIAAAAITAARTRYGMPSAFGTPVEFAERRGTFDIVVCLEAVEHVPDPVAFLAEALEWLKPGGRLLVSTPNQDAAPWGSVWGSDIPPVHLTWFGERSLGIAAERAGAQMDRVTVSVQGPGDRGYGTRVLEPTLDLTGQPAGARIHTFMRRAVRVGNRSIAPVLSWGAITRALPAVIDDQQQTLTVILTRTA